MRNHRMPRIGTIVVFTGLLGYSLSPTHGAEPGESSPVQSPASAVERTPALPESQDEAGPEPSRVTLDVARDRARLMYEIYSTTLETLHHRYFHGDRAMVPARAMEDVFKEIARRDQTQARWISASLRPMSVNHEPKTAFEKRASKQIAKGADVVEGIEDGYYRRAGSISLRGGCVSCHAGHFAATSPSPKFAGLIISIPVDPAARLTDEKLPSASLSPTP